MGLIRGQRADALWPILKTENFVLFRFKHFMMRISKIRFWIKRNLSIFCKIHGNSLTAADTHADHGILFVSTHQFV